MKSNTVNITLERIGKPSRRYTEGFVEDDGNRLKTRTVLKPEHGSALTGRWREQGLLSARDSIGAVEKRHFYRECFTILTVFDRRERLLGYYCDIATPLRKSGGEYLLTDLILDLWITPDGKCIVLDRDEFDEATEKNLLSQELREKAVGTLGWLQEKIAAGRFPTDYLH